MRSKTNSYSGGFGKWLHLGLSSPKDTDIVTPNNDTADLRAAQTQLSVIHPPTDDGTRTRRERPAPQIEHPPSQMERAYVFP